MGAKSGEGHRVPLQKSVRERERECEAPAGVCVWGLPARVASALGLGQWGVAGDVATTCPRCPGGPGAAVRGPLAAVLRPGETGAAPGAAP